MFKRIRDSVWGWVARSMSPYQEEVLASRASAIGGVGLAGLGAFNETKALGVCSFYAAVSFIAETCASLPIEVQARVPGTKRWETLPDHDLDFLLNQWPNVDQTGMACHQQRYVHQLMHAQSFTLIRYEARDGSPAALWPLHPSAVTLIDDPHRGRLYRCQLDSGTETLDRSQMLHLTGLTVDGLTPLSPLRLFSANLNLSNGARTSAAAFHTNRPAPGLIAHNKGLLKDDQRIALQGTLDNFTSAANAGKSLILEGAQLELKEGNYGMSFADSQLLELLAANDKDIGEKIFRMPPATLKGWEQKDFFECYTIRPFLERDAQELSRKLPYTSDLRRLRIRHNTDELLRMNPKERMDMLRVGVMCGILRINEARELLEYGPDPKGNELYLPQSVFGKPGTTPTVNPIQKTRQRSRERPGVSFLDECRGLLTEKFEGLFSREVHAIEKLAKLPADQWPSKLSEFYGKHREHVAARLKTMPEARSRLVMAAIQQHEADLRGQPLTPDQIEPLSQRLTAEALTLANQVLEPT